MTTETEEQVGEDVALLDLLDWTPACEGQWCQHGHPAAEHVLRPRKAVWPCDCGDLMLLLCRWCARPNYEYWGWGHLSPYRCHGCSHRELLIIPADEGQVHPL